MENSSPKPFMARVRARLPELQPSERRLAETILDFPGDMAGYSASEIAALAGVSNATVSRFVRKIGYGSYDEARKAIRDQSQSGAALLRFGAAGDAGTSAVAAHLEQSRLNLEKTFDSFKEGMIDDLVQAMHRAPRVWLAGFRAGYPLANYLAWQIGQVLPQVSLLPKPGETLAEQISLLSERDVLVVLALRRGSRLLQPLIDAARDADTKMALIGDIPALEAQSFKWSFLCATSSNGPLLNHTGVFALCNLIAARTLEQSGPEGRERLGRIEDIHDRFAEL